MTLKHLLTCSFLLVACAPDNGTDGDGSGAGQNTGAGSSGGSGGSGAGSEDGGSGAGFIDNGGGNTTNTMECASEAIEAEIAPLAMFITLDKSGSMDSDNKWENATAALKSFFGDAAAADLNVALRFFPEGNCSDGDCDINACATPNVPLGTLTADPAPADAQEAALVAAINAQGPNGGTPMSAALAGGVQFSANYLVQNPLHKAVVILVTDGEPSGCEENIAAIANIAASGFLDDVITYTIGLAGSNEGDLAQISMAGGGSSFVIGNGDTQAELLAALQAIQGEQIACEIPIPVPTKGDFDPTLVNVTFTSGDGAESPIGGVANAGACGADAGWYYDNPADPALIILCPASCDTVQGDDEGKLEVVLGCETIPG